MKEKLFYSLCASMVGKNRGKEERHPNKNQKELQTTQKQKNVQQIIEENNNQQHYCQENNDNYNKNYWKKVYTIIIQKKVSEQSTFKTICIRSEIDPPTLNRGINSSSEGVRVRLSLKVGSLRRQQFEPA